MKILVHKHNGHLYIVRYEEGSEKMVLDHLAEQVQRKDTYLTWFDAASLAYQMKHGDLAK
jgi:hypothetical protein